MIAKINLVTIGGEIISFIILVVILRLFLYKPVTKHLARRSQKIKENLEEIERQKVQLASLKSEYESRLEKMEEQGRQLIEQAKREAYRAREEIIIAAHAEASKIIKEAERQMEIEKRRALEDLRNAVASLAVVAASKVVSRLLDEQAQQRLIDEGSKRGDWKV